MGKPTDYIDEFCSYLIIERILSNNSILAYNRDILQYCEYLENELELYEIKAVKRENIITFLATLYDLNLKPRSISRKISAIKNFHKFLFLNNYVTENVSSFIELPKLEKTLPVVLSVNEMDEIIDTFTVDEPIELRNKTMVELMYSTGLRVSELVNLNVEDIHLTMGFVRCRGKGSKERIIPIGEMSLHLLEQYLQHGREKLNVNYDNQILFLNQRGGRITRQAFGRILKNHVRLTNIQKNVKPHTLRHTYATHMLENNADMRYIQEMLGHSDLEITKVYTHINPNKLKNVLNEFHPRSKIHINNQKGEKNEL